MLTLRGYAVPFFTTRADAGYMIAAQAFIGQTADKPVGLRYGSHEARDFLSTRNGALSLFEDDYGLGFEATLPDTSFGRAIANAVLSKRLGCSISRQTVGRARHPDVFTAAEISHIALVADPAWKGTAVWVAGQALSGEVKRLADQWYSGHYRAKAEPGFLVRACPSLPPPKPKAAAPAVVAPVVKPKPAPIKAAAAAPADALHVMYVANDWHDYKIKLALYPEWQVETSARSLQGDRPVRSPQSGSRKDHRGKTRRFFLLKRKFLQKRENGNQNPRPA